MCTLLALALAAVLTYVCWKSFSSKGQKPDEAEKAFRAMLSTEKYINSLVFGMKCVDPNFTSSNLSVNAKQLIETVVRENMKGTEYTFNSDTLVLKIHRNSMDIRETIDYREYEEAQAFIGNPEKILHSVKLVAAGHFILHAIHVKTQVLNPALLEPLDFPFDSAEEILSEHWQTVKELLSVTDDEDDCIESIFEILQAKNNLPEWLVMISVRGTNVFEWGTGSSFEAACADIWNNRAGVQ